MIGRRNRDRWQRRAVAFNHVVRRQARARRGRFDQLGDVANLGAVGHEDDVPFFQAGLCGGRIRYDMADLHRLHWLHRRQGIGDAQCEHNRRCGEVVGDRPSGDGRHPGKKAFVRVQLRIVGVDVLVGVHSRNLHVGEERNHRDLEDRRAAFRLVSKQRWAESDAVSQHPHPEGSSGQIVATLVNDDEHRQRNDCDEDLENHAIHAPSITLRSGPSRQRAGPGGPQSWPAAI